MFENTENVGFVNLLTYASLIFKKDMKLLQASPRETQLESKNEGGALVQESGTKKWNPANAADVKKRVMVNEIARSFI